MIGGTWEMEGDVTDTTVSKTVLDVANGTFSVTIARGSLAENTVQVRVNAVCLG